MLHAWEQYKIAVLALLQRTELQSEIGFIRKTNSRRVLARILTNRFARFVAVLIGALKYDQVINKYISSVEQESELLQGLVKKFPAAINVVDIGCGIGAYHARWLGVENQNGALYLLDRSKFNLSALRYGLGEVNRYYNSLSLTRSFLGKFVGNSSAIKIHAIEADSEVSNDYEKLLPQTIHICVSFISWGFHYPLETYWDLVVKRLCEGGQIVVDLRKNQLDIKVISGYQVEVISENEKYQRILITK